MNKNTVEKWVLLEQSGELSARKKRLLDRCEGAKALRDELTLLQSAWPQPDCEPSPWATTKIQARLRGERRSVLLPVRVWSPIVAVAACMALMVSVWDFRPETSPMSAAVVAVEADAWSLQFEEELVELESLILAISGTSLDMMEM